MQIHAIVDLHPGARELGSATKHPGIGAQIEARHVRVAGTRSPERRAIVLKREAGPAVFPRFVVNPDQSSIIAEACDDADVSRQQAAVRQRQDLLDASGIRQLGGIEIRQSLSGTYVEALDSRWLAHVVKNAVTRSESEKTARAVLPVGHGHEDEADNSEPS